MIEPGDGFPEFELKGASDGDIRSFSLEELTDESALLLNIYAYDFQPTCENQICGVDDVKWLTFTEGLNVVGLNGDGPFAHRRFTEEKAISYPLLSDTDHSILREIGTLYSELNNLKEVPRRSVLLIDQTGTVRYRWTATDNTASWTNAPIEEVQEVAERLDSVKIKK